MKNFIFCIVAIDRDFSIEACFKTAWQVTFVYFYFQILASSFHQMDGQRDKNGIHRTMQNSQLQRTLSAPFKDLKSRNESKYTWLATFQVN